MNGYYDLQKWGVTLMTLDTLISQFDKCTRIGKGGQKTVFKVEKGSEVYALKIILSINDPRINQEISILQKVRISNVPRIIQTGIIEDDLTHDPILFILEDFINGRSLREELQLNKTVSTDQACRILESLLETEIELEKEGIVHRDIKPDNIILAHDGNIFLIDFGIAKILGNTSFTQTGAINGPCTPGYAPAELAFNVKSQQDVRTDLFQIGVTVYEALSGSNPFRRGAKNPNEVFNNTRTLLPPQISIIGDTKGQFFQYLQMLMAKNPSQRPRNAEEAFRYFSAISSTIIR